MNTIPILSLLPPQVVNANHGLISHDDSFFKERTPEDESRERNEIMIPENEPTRTRNMWNDLKGDA